MNDKIKALLDAECWKNNWATCPIRRFKGKDCRPGFKPHSCEVECWQCHKNDALTDRIEEAQKVKTAPAR